MKKLFIPILAIGLMVLTGCSKDCYTCTGYFFTNNNSDFTFDLPLGCGKYNKNYEQCKQEMKDFASKNNLEYVSSILTID